MVSLACWKEKVHVCGSNLWIISCPYGLGWRKCFVSRITYSSLILLYVGIINYIPKCPLGSFYFKKSCIYNKWFTLHCNVYLRVGAYCPVHQLKKLQMKTLEDSQRMKQGDQFPNRLQSWLWVKNKTKQNAKFKVSTTKWDLVNILHFKMSMQMCDKTLCYICACFLETLQGNYCNAEKSLPLTLQPCHTVVPTWILFMSILRARSLGEAWEPILNVRSVWGGMGTVDRREKICLDLFFFNDKDSRQGK